MPLPIGSLVVFTGASPDIGDFEPGYGWTVGTLLVVVRTREESFDYGEMYVAPLEFPSKRVGPCQGQMVMEEEVLPLHLAMPQSAVNNFIEEVI